MCMKYFLKEVDNIQFKCIWIDELLVKIHQVLNCGIFVYVLNTITFKKLYPRPFSSVRDVLVGEISTIIIFNRKKYNDCSTDHPMFELLVKLILVYSSL